jgi:hypothetical protein
MKKGGQVQISFGMIFSIIIIIATLATAFYAIRFFLGIQNCAQAGSFVESLKNRVDLAWKSEISQDVYTLKPSKGIEEVCFGNLTQSDSVRYPEEYKQLRFYSKNGENVFLYPPRNSCGTSLSAFNMKHFRVDNFFCVKIKQGTATIKLSKGSFDSLVTITNATK